MTNSNEKLSTQNPKSTIKSSRNIQRKTVKRQTKISKKQKNSQKNFRQSKNSNSKKSKAVEIQQLNSPKRNSKRKSFDELNENNNQISSKRRKANQKNFRLHSLQQSPLQQYSYSSVLIEPKKFFFGLPGDENQILVLGSGDCAQLGLTSDRLECKKPTPLPSFMNLDPAYISAGSLHNIVITRNHGVYSFGCNDDMSLGRQTEPMAMNETNDEQQKPDINQKYNTNVIVDEFTPGEVHFSVLREDPTELKIVKATAGSSHTLYISSKGNVFLSGLFRDSQGPMGVSGGSEIPPNAVEIQFVNENLPPKFIDIASGDNFGLLLDNCGNVYMLGDYTGEPLRRSSRNNSNRMQIDPKLIPRKVEGLKNVIKIFAGSMSAWLITQDRRNGEEYIWAFGPNHYSQLGISNDDKSNDWIKKPRRLEWIPSQSKILKVSGGARHSLFLIKNSGRNRLFAAGSNLDGRCGFGRTVHTLYQPTQIILKDTNAEIISCSASEAGSILVLNDGTAKSSGDNSTLLLGQLNEEEIYQFQTIEAKSLEQRKIITAEMGSQHSIFLAQQIVTKN